MINLRRVFENKNSNGLIKTLLNIRNDDDSDMRAMIAEE